MEDIGGERRTTVGVDSLAKSKITGFNLRFRTLCDPQDSDFILEYKTYTVLNCRWYKNKQILLNSFRSIIAMFTTPEQNNETYTRGDQGSASLYPQLDLHFFPASIASPILACNDLYPRRIHHLVRLHLERWILDDERPYIVTQSVGVQVTLIHPTQHLSLVDGRETHLQRCLRLHLFHHRIR